MVEPWPLLAVRIFQDLIYLVTSWKGKAMETFPLHQSVSIYIRITWRAFKNSCAQAAPQINGIRISGDGIPTSVIFKSVQVIRVYSEQRRRFCTWVSLLLNVYKRGKQLATTEAPPSYKHSIIYLIGSRFYPCFCGIRS